MGDIADAFDSAFRAYNTDGVPASGAHKPVKSDIRNIGDLIEDEFGYINGAVGDATADDTSAVVASFAASALSGKWLDGQNKTYAVSGNVSLPAGLKLRNAKFKQLTPNSTTRRTLVSAGVNNLSLENVTVDRNGTGAQGSLSDAAGVWISGGSGHHLRGIEVFGDGKGSGIAIHGTSDSSYYDLYAHDIDFDEPGATDDRVQGIWLNGNTNCSFYSPRATRLKGNATGLPDTRYTRGICVAGSVRCTIIDPKVSVVDQGLDASGSAGNVWLTVLGGHIKDCCTFGLKIANSGWGVTVIGTVAMDCGWAGFVVSGPAESGLTYKGEDILFLGCKAYNIGSNGFAGAHIGFRIMQAAFDLDFPKGITFSQCEAHDTQNTPTMQYGFHCEVGPDTTIGKFNTLNECRSFRHLTAASLGFQNFNCLVRGSSTQAVATATPTIVSFQTGNEDIDGCEMHSDSTNPERITIQKRGYYRIHTGVAFAANATGFRRVQIRKGGVNIPGANRSVAALGGTQTSAQAETISFCLPGQYFDVEVEQTSGGSLDISRPDSSFSAFWLGDA